MKKYLLLMMFFILNASVSYAQTDTLIKSAHYKIETYEGDKINYYEFTEFYNKKGQIDSIYRKPIWADSTYSEYLSEKHIYLPNGKLDYILKYDTDDIIGQLLLVKNYIYDSDDEQKQRFDSLQCVVHNIHINGNGSILEIIKLTDFNFFYSIVYWKIEKYNSKGQLSQKIDLLNNNYLVYYYYHSNGLIKEIISQRAQMDIEFDNTLPIYNSYKYQYNQKKDWIIQKVSDSFESVIEKTYRTIEYYSI